MAKKKKREFQRPMRPRPFGKPEEGETTAPKAVDAPMRLNKFIAHAGVCNRRAAAELVKRGEIKVNGAVQTNPGYAVQPADIVLYKDSPLKPEEKLVYLLMNKPKDVIAVPTEDETQRTVHDITGDKIKEKVQAVGSLADAETGLLLLTNDEILLKKLAQPQQKITQFFQVTTGKPVTAEDLKKIRNGVTLDGEVMRVVNADLIKNTKQNEVGIGIEQERPGVVRRIFEHLGYEVLKVDRVYYAGLTKKDLPRGWFRHLTEKEVIMLKHFT